MSFEDPWKNIPEAQAKEAKKELNEYGEQMKEALADLIVNKASSEEELREAFADSLVLQRVFDNVIGDNNFNETILDEMQKLVDDLVQKHNLDASKFSVHRLDELIKKYEEKKV